MERLGGKRAVTAPLVVEFESHTLYQVEADLTAAGFFADERPLRGVAGLVDWRLCGLLSQLLEQERLRGELGEAILVSTGGRLRAPRVLLLGLGDHGDFRERRLSLVRSVSGDVVRRALRLGVRTLALAAPGVAPFELPTYAPALIEGVLEAVRGATLGLRLRLIVPGTEAARVARALVAAAPVVPGGVSYQLVRPQASPKPPHPSGVGPRLPATKSSSIPHRY